MEGDVLYPDPELTFKTKLADLPLIIQEMIFANKINDNGVLIRSSTDKPPYFAVGFKSEKANHKYRFVWLYKVRAKPVTETWFCILFQNQFTPDDVLDNYPVDWLMHNIALALMAVQSQENARALRTLAGMQATTAQLTVKSDTGATGQPGLTRAYAESSVKLNGDQKTQMQILDAFAKDSNLEIVVHPSVSTVEGAVNGAYIEGNVIHIGLDAIDQGYVQAGFHEAVHWIAQNAQTNPDAYSGLEQTVFDALRENGADVDSLVRQRIEQYAQNGVNISEQAAREEIVAESCGMVLTDAQNMLKFAQEHKSAFQAVMDKFIQFWKKLKSIAASIGNKNQRTEMQTLLGKDSALQKIYDNFMAAAKETGVVFGGANAENQDTRYSLNVLPDGQKYVEVDTAQEEFDGKSVKEMQKTAINLIKSMFPSGAMIGTSDEVIVTGRTAREYAYPAKRVTNKATFESKMRASAELDNLLEAGTYVSFAPDGANNHSHPNTKGFEYYQTTFRVGDEWYSGLVNVRITNDDAKIFGSIIKVGVPQKRETK